MDMRRPNEAVVRERHLIPVVDEVLQNMNESAVLSKLDLKLGYHPIYLDEASRQITTFKTQTQCRIVSVQTFDVWYYISTRAVSTLDSASNPRV